MQEEREHDNPSDVSAQAQSSESAQNGGLAATVKLSLSERALLNLNSAYRHAYSKVSSALGIERLKTMISVREIAGGLWPCLGATAGHSFPLKGVEFVTWPLAVRPS